MIDRRVTIRPAAAQLAGLTVVLDLVGQPTLTGGIGGWSGIDRPRRTAALEWTGLTTRTQTLPLLLDGLEVQRGVDVSIEPQVRAVEAWGTPNAATGDEPPPLTLAGPIPATGGQWVLQDVDWGPYSRDANTGQRIQQTLTLTLLEYVSAQLLKSPAKKVRHGGH